MIYPPSYSSSLFSSSSNCCHPPSNKNGNNNNDDDDDASSSSTSIIIDVGRHRSHRAIVGDEKMKKMTSTSTTTSNSNKRGLNAVLLLKMTTLLSTLIVALVVIGSSSSSSGRHTSQYHVNHQSETISLLRRRGGDSLSLSSPSSTTYARLLQQQNFDDENNNNNNNNNTAVVVDSSSSSACVCSLESCQATYSTDDLCPDDESFIKALHPAIQYLILIILLLFSALFSGLTLGLMSLDLTGLEIVMAGDDPNAARYAKDIYPVRQKGNLLLCTLLLGNVAVNSLMSIFSAEIFDGTVGFILSTFLIVIFGEIIPQAFCSRYALRIGSTTIPLVKIIRVLLFVIAWPLAKGLDLMLGRELATTYSNAEMIELLNVHVKENKIDQEEANAMAGALTYKTMCVKDVMTAMEQTYMLAIDEKLSFETIGKIFKTGYSRIPIFEISRDNIVGILFVKDLIFLDPEDNVPVRSFIQIFGRNVHLVWPDDTLGEVLTELKKGNSHLAIVRDVNNEDESKDPVYEVKGIITLEDIVECIIGDEIVDETDAFVDNDQRIKVERGDTFEWARLRLLDTKIVDEMLSASEISAVTAHLKTNHTKSFQLLTDMQLRRLVSSTPVTTFSTATQDLNKELPNELLYEKGTPSDTFTLVLSGRITILVGSENFKTDLSSWSVLGASALQTKDWIPDYSAFVSDGPCRCIRIGRDSFIESSDALENDVSIALSAIDSVEEDVTSFGESAPSVASSTDEHVPNNRKTVLKLLFHGDDDKVDLISNGDAPIVQFTDPPETNNNEQATEDAG